MSSRPYCRVLSLCLLTLFACSDEQVNEPDSDSGLALADVDQERDDGVAAMLESADLAIEFEGSWDPATGLLDIRPIQMMTMGLEYDEATGDLRRSDDALFCEIRVTAGARDTLSLTSDPATIGSHEDGPTGPCGVGGPPLNLPYDSPLASGAFCAEVAVRSHFTDAALTDVYAAITEISSETSRAYTYAEFLTLGLGTGAQPPVGLNAPSDQFGGLFAYGDLQPNAASNTKWIFRYDGQPFTFRGVMMGSFQESCNGFDDDCDGTTDEEAGCYPNGDQCLSDADCQSAFCDPSIRLCDGSILPEDCSNGIDDNGDGDIDCLDRRCAGLDGCADFSCLNGNLGSPVSVFDPGGASLSVVSGRAAQTVVGELSDFTLTNPQCGSDFGGAERAFLWEAPVAGAYQFAGTSNEFDVALIVTRAAGCPFDLDVDFDAGRASCADAVSGLGSESISVNAIAGETFVILVGSAISADAALGVGNFELIVEKTPACGDAFHDPYGDLLGAPGEFCDDGVASANCDADCTEILCNDGVINQVIETCEDGNDAAGDGCSDACVVETGWDCPILGQPCFEVCGDGLIVGVEGCDDGNDDGGDGCPVDCSAVETGWDCTAPNIACDEICGDVLRVGAEACDDGNFVDGDGCTLDCLVVEDGYRCPTAGGACDDIDECVEASDDCSANAACTNSIGSFSCTCNSGFRGDGVTCDNIDECDEGLDNCNADATCTDTSGAFTCACNSGFTGDGVLCADIDECLGAPCDTDALCTNSVGDFACACNAGYSGDGFVCDDIDECGEGTDNCAANTTCSNSPGTFGCACAPGFEGDPLVGCTDIDECLADPCDASASCANVVGGFSCTCGAGYVGDGFTCTDVDECTEGLDNCGANSACTNLDPDTDGAPFACGCLPGFEGDPVLGCTDLDECTLNTDNCNDNAICANTVGSFACTCLPGFVGNGVSCDDLNECITGDNDCDSNATCQNTTGDFLCICNDGFQGTGDVCTDLDECDTATDNCSDDATCANLDFVVEPDPFTCSCNPGYGGDGVTCGDLDECALGTDDCDGNASCSNNVGGFTCACLPGYQGTGQVCADVNECDTNNGGCLGNAICVNSPGSSSCSCPSGYELSGDGLSCLDLNECSLGTDNCSADATCSNTAGGFSCACNSGFSGDGVTCNNVNECVLGTDNCNSNAACADLTPSAGNGFSRFACTCNSGFTGDGVSCIDDNECALGTDNCNSAALCTNTPGSFTCACREGFTGNGVSCTNVNECTANTDNCHPDAGCSDVVPSAGNGWERFSCTCNSGYSGDGVSCNDINECLSNPCGIGTTCTNNPGSYSCACTTGYSGGDAYGAGCYPICGDGLVRPGPGSSGNQNSEQCDYGAGGVAGPGAPACETPGGCGYCNSNCDNASVGVNSAGCSNSSDDDGDTDPDCEDTSCSGVFGCYAWACSQIDDYMRREGTKVGALSGNDYGFTYQQQTGTQDCNCDPCIPDVWNTCCDQCPVYTYPQHGDDYSVLFESPQQYRRVRAQSVSPANFDTFMFVNQDARMCGGNSADYSDDDGGSGTLSSVTFDGGPRLRRHTIVVEEYRPSSAAAGAAVGVNFDVQGCQGGYRTDCNGVCQPSGWMGDGTCDNGGRRPTSTDQTADFYCGATFAAEVCSCTGNARGVCGQSNECRTREVSCNWLGANCTTQRSTRACDNCGCGQCTGWSGWSNGGC